MATPQLLVGGLTFPEGPRWHDGDFYFSHFTDRTLYRATSDGELEAVWSHTGDILSASGFLPDGALLVTSSLAKRLVRVVDGATEVHADLSGFAGDAINDMTVDGDGNAYVGTRSGHMRPSKSPLSDDWAIDTVVLVDGEGNARLGADGLVAPNGMVVAPDGSYLVVAETYAARLTRYDRAPDGSLDNRRVFAELPGTYPDGICLDDNDAIWVASPYSGEVIRVLDGGQVTDRLTMPGAVACALGGEQRRTLFMLCAAPGVLVDLESPEPASPRPSSDVQPAGHISTMPVDHAGAGWP